MSDDQPHWRSGKSPEPFYIKSVAPLRRSTRREREQALDSAKYNLFNLKSDQIYIDLLTDSGTGAMSHNQWAALMHGDEAYAGSSSFDRFAATVREIFGFQHVLPSHQGRSAELVLMTHFLSPGDYVPNNIHFDTTMAHVQFQQAHDVNLVVDDVYDWESEHPFKGNIDLGKLEAFMRQHADQVPLVCLTLTCNSGGGQPVSLENVKQTKRLCDMYGKPLFIDSARVIENSWFIKQREPAYRDWPVARIAHEIMAHADGMWMSAKKDGLVNIGGFIAVHDRALYEQLRMYTILFDGFVTYGGMSGRDMDALAVGLRECCEEEYLAHRTGQVAHVSCLLHDHGIRTTWPPGGHAVYIDGRDFCPHLPDEQYPAQALSLALYLEAGVRSVEIGIILRGREPDTGENRYAGLDLVRLAIPRRMYTFTQLEFVANSLIELKRRAAEIRGVRFARETPVLRHFTSEYELVEATAAAS
jgi:tyrosine phenol-lyase